MSKPKLDRFLLRRGDSWFYHRRVPSALVEKDSRAPFVRRALGTRDLVIARKQRDLLAAADDDLWATMMLEANVDSSRARYAAALKRVQALGFGYIEAESIPNALSWPELSQRLESIMPPSTPPEVEDAVLGLVDAPSDKFSDALRIYMEGPGKRMLANKSPNQLRIWKNIPTRAIARFTEVVSDKPLGEITRADALAFYRYWLNKVMPDDDSSAMHPSSANREIGELRKLFREYFSFQHNDATRMNPFFGLNFKEDGTDQRPPFSDEWIREKFLTKGPLSGLNEEARAIFLAIVETGCRPSEICGLTPANIVLEHDVPHLQIRARRATDRKNPDVANYGVNQLKSSAAAREIPLVGVSLSVFQKFTKGFDRYRDKAGTVSQTINSYLAENNLLPSESHTLYGLRHSFEDRMKRSGIDYEVRMGLFGHALPRPAYGEDGGLRWRQQLLTKMAFRFDSDLMIKG